MDALLAAAPVLGASQLAGAAGGLTSMAGAFGKLGLKPEMVAKAVPVLTQFVSKSGGAGVGSLLAGVLKQRPLRVSRDNLLSGRSPAIYNRRL